MSDFMIKCKRKIFCCTVILSLLFMNTAQNVPVTLQDPLCRALQATGAELHKAYITGRVQTTLPADDLVRLKEQVREIGRELSSATDCTLEVRKSSYREYVHLSFNEPNRQGIVSAKKIAEQNLAPDQVEFIIHIILETPEEMDIIRVRAKILGILQKFQASPLISTCLEGYLDGKLRKDVWKCCFQDAFETIQAKRITRIENQNYASDTGYSSLLPAKMLAGQENVNLNMAMRYHAFDQRTYVIIGSPMITIDY